jgi:hypothetical protein
VHIQRKFSANVWMLGFADALQGEARIEVLYPNLRKGMSSLVLGAQKKRLSDCLSCWKIIYNLRKSYQDYTKFFAVSFVPLRL